MLPYIFPVVIWNFDFVDDDVIEGRNVIKINFFKFLEFYGIHEFYEFRVLLILISQKTRE